MSSEAAKEHPTAILPEISDCLIVCLHSLST